MTRLPKTSLRTFALLAGWVLALSSAAVVAASSIGKTGLFDGGVIAYVSECAFVAEGLYQVDVAHLIRHRLTNQQERIYSLAYSPSGRWLVFEAMERGAQSAFNRRVYAIDLEANRQYLLAPDYISLDNTALEWKPDGVHLELRMMPQLRLQIEDVVVDVASGEVTESSPIPDAFVPRQGSAGGVASTIFTPPSSNNTAYSQANRVDADLSVEGIAVRSRLINGRFDLYIETSRSAAPLRLTDDNCVERYPRWRPSPV